MAGGGPAVLAPTLTGHHAGLTFADLPLPETVVPAFLRLLSERRLSGRYQASDLLTKEDAAGAAVPSEIA